MLIVFTLLKFTFFEKKEPLSVLSNTHASYYLSNPSLYRNIVVNNMISAVFYP